MQMSPWLHFRKHEFFQLICTPDTWKYINYYTHIIWVFPKNRGCLPPPNHPICFNRVWFSMKFSPSILGGFLSPYFWVDTCRPWVLSIPRSLREERPGSAVVGKPWRGVRKGWRLGGVTNGPQRGGGNNKKPAKNWECQEFRHSKCLRWEFFEL